ncbi:MAG TPA: FAD-linked oxidase C-terminal domain-containing protein [Gaiellaceae bacterium]|nr:FAD-linked oxidase C-terminal domain-containing protein [Gaiellaceae bacterium]
MSGSRSSRSAVRRELETLLGAGAVLPGDTAPYLSDATEGRGLRGRADAVALPGTTAEVASVVAWCYERDVALVPRGGGTGFTAGAVPTGGVVLSLERLNAVRSFEPLLWRMHVEAGVRTGDVRRLARENGLLFPPDPGAAEQSQIGGNVATNAGGPHAFKYGATGAWVTGLEAVVPPGEVVSLGGPIRKDVAGYDLRSLLVGSEGTLGVITAAWLRLIPAPDAFLPVAAVYDGVQAGCAAIEAVVGNGLPAAALEYLDAATLAAAGPSFPGGLPAEAGFLVLAEADGTAAGAERLRDELVDVLGEYALAVATPRTPAATAELWRWRDGVSIAVTAQRGGKVSEDIVVPLERLRDAIEATVAIGERHGLPACSWGHAGDGNLHATFLVDARDEAGLERAEAASGDVFELAVRLGGSVSGEHGIGLVKRGRLALQWAPAAVALHARVKEAFDPKNLMNPGKKI